MVEMTARNIESAELAAVMPYKKPEYPLKMYRHMKYPKEPWAAGIRRVLARYGDLEGPDMVNEAYQIAYGRHE